MQGLMGGPNDIPHVRFYTQPSAIASAECALNDTVIYYLILKTQSFKM